MPVVRSIDDLDRITCVRCTAPYRPVLVDGCPVCGLDAVGYDADAADQRITAMVIGTTALNLLLLALIVIAVS